MILSTYVQDHLILLTAHPSYAPPWYELICGEPYSHNIRTRDCTTTTAKEIIPPTVVPTCDRHFPASSKVKSNAHIISSPGQSITDTPIHARMPDPPKRIDVNISTNISSCMRVSMP